MNDEVLPYHRIIGKADFNYEKAEKKILKPSGIIRNWLIEHRDPVCYVFSNRRQGPLNIDYSHQDNDVHFQYLEEKGGTWKHSFLMNGGTANKFCCQSPLSYISCTGSEIA